MNKLGISCQPNGSVLYRGSIGWFSNKQLAKDYGWVNPMKDFKIVIDGPPGVGKSTVAAFLANTLDIPYVPESFKDNPHLPNGRPQDITSYYFKTIQEQYYSASNGVFDVSQEASNAIYCPGATFANYKKLHYDVRINLFAPKEVIRQRIISRARSGLVEVELANHEERFSNYLNYISKDRGQTGYVVDANFDPYYIVKNICLLLNSL